MDGEQTRRPRGRRDVNRFRLLSYDPHLTAKALVPWGAVFVGFVCCGVRNTAVFSFWVVSLESAAFLSAVLGGFRFSEGTPPSRLACHRSTGKRPEKVRGEGKGRQGPPK